MTREKRKIAAKEFKEWRDSYYNKNKLPATMFIEEVIKILEQEPCDKCEVGNPCLYCKHEFEPKTVLYSGDGYADGYMVYDMAECPNCGYEYEDGDKDWGLSFCPNCGQKLDWESEKQE